MSQSTEGSSRSASQKQPEIEALVDSAWARVRPELIRLVMSFSSGPIGPSTFRMFEVGLRGLMREFGRMVMEVILYKIEGAPGLSPHDVLYEGQGYRRLGKKTRNAFVATLFGTIVLWRVPYRFWDPRIKERCVFPLELRLGLLEGVTPALSDWLGKELAEAGASQARVLERLRDQCGVAMGVKRLRNFLAGFSAEMGEFREATQVESLLEALREAYSSRGNRKPVLAVGRDGTTICEHRHGFWQVATTATLTVFDRRGNRLRTVYLAWRPEPGQTTLGEMLTRVLTETLLGWAGPLPSLAYISDSGASETGYFERCLKHMRHPQTGEPLPWRRVVDFYHTAIRVWTMARVLFGDPTPACRKWARRMLHKLKNQSRGAKRVLHSAATFAKRRKMSKAKRTEFNAAYRFVRERTRWMNYAELKRCQIPIGSGITEAACKTIYGQRLKLSGMRWSMNGAQSILTLRSILLSGVWKSSQERLLQHYESKIPTPYAGKTSCRHKLAA